MIKLPDLIQRYLASCCIGCCMLIACSSPADNDEELFRDGIHTGVFDKMGEEVFNKFENELGITIYRGENPPDVAAALENMHSQGEISKAFDAATFNADAYQNVDAYWFVDNIVTANTGLGSLWIHEDNNNPGSFRFWAPWLIRPYGYNAETHTIENRLWHPNPALLSCPSQEGCQMCICEASGSSEWAYVMGDESNFTIFAMVNFFSSKYDIDAGHFVSNDPTMDLYVAFSGSMSERGVENPEFGIIMHEHKIEITGWPEGAGFVKTTRAGYAGIFSISRAVPW